MPSGFDARVGIAKETTFGTRVAPARFLPLTAEDLGFAQSRYFSPAIGTGLWGRPSIPTTGVGSGSLSGDVPSVGFSYLIDGLHGNTVTPVQIGATPAYTHTHTLSTPPTKSHSVQVQMPPVTSSTLVPHDMLGVVFGGITFSWNPAEVLSYEIPTVYRELKTDQANASYTPPSAYDLFNFKNGSLTVGGVLETNIIGSGSFTIGYELRDDAFALGSNGLIAFPVITDKPTGSGTFTADFNDNTNITRVLNNTTADIVLKFEGATISGANKYTVQLTLPDCVFTTDRPTVDGPGPVQQTVTFSTASSTGDAPEIKIISTETTI